MDHGIGGLYVTRLLDQATVFRGYPEAVRTDNGPEFTSLCLKTGQPDFAALFLDYIPDRRCVVLKSLKLYIWSFRDEGHFHEDVTNRIIDDLVRATEPRFMRLTSKFYVRGGIFTNVVAEQRKAGWEPAPRVELTRFAENSNTRG